MINPMAVSKKLKNSAEFIEGVLICKIDKPSYGTVAEAAKCIDALVVENRRLKKKIKRQKRLIHKLHEELDAARYDYETLAKVAYGEEDAFDEDN